MKHRSNYDMYHKIEGLMPVKVNLESQELMLKKQLWKGLF